MNHYITIRRGKKSHVIAGPFETLQTAKLMRFKYFFTGYDHLCDETPERLTINHSNQFLDPSRQNLDRSSRDISPMNQRRFPGNG